MNATDQLLRETFDNQADSVTMAPRVRAGIDSYARRYRTRRMAAVATGAAAMLAAGVAVPAAIQHRYDTPSVNQPADFIPGAVPAPYDSWEPRGSLAGDEAFIASALAAWDAAGPSAGPHAVINVLWAGDLQTGRAAALVGTDATGERRIAVIAGGGKLGVIRDSAAPDVLVHLSFNLFTDGTASDGSTYQDSLVVVTPPDSGWTVMWLGGDDPGQGGGSQVTDNGIAMIDISQSGPQGHPTIRLLNEYGVVYSGPIGSMS